MCGGGDERVRETSVAKLKLLCAQRRLMSLARRVFNFAWEMRGIRVFGGECDRGTVQVRSGPGAGASFRARDLCLCVEE
jgi:hypothetical protein